MNRFLNGLFIVICIIQKISSYEQYVCESSSCLVTGIDFYIDGIKLSALTLAQQLELTGYQKQLTNYEKEMETYEELMSHGHTGLPPPKPPSRPSFCSVPVVFLDGCVSIAGKLYVGNTFVRNLTSDEQKKVKNFVEQYKKYEDNRIRTPNERDGSSADVSDMMNNSNAALMDPLDLQMPEKLDICMSL